MTFYSRLNWILSEQFGISIKLFLVGLKRLPWYARALLKYVQQSDAKILLMPCLHDLKSANGSYGEYFYQDLFVARQIFERNPVNHLDIGSRIDGFVGHIASFRTITVADIRPQPVQVPNVDYIQLDLMSDACIGALGKYDSISCLHALEHFGLGRYGDDISHNGWKLALRNMSGLLAQGGLLYISVPVGEEVTFFNAHRVFSIDTLITQIKLSGLRIASLYVYDPSIMKIISCISITESLSILRSCTYRLALIVAVKT
jgi:hypothetical protein